MALRRPRRRLGRLPRRDARELRAPRGEPAATRGCSSAAPRHGVAERPRARRSPSASARSGVVAHRTRAGGAAPDALGARTHAAARPPRSSTRSRGCCASGTCTTASPWGRLRGDRPRHPPGRRARGRARRARGAGALERSRPAARQRSRRCATCCGSSSWRRATSGRSRTSRTRCSAPFGRLDPIELRRLRSALRHADLRQAQEPGADAARAPGASCCVSAMRQPLEFDLIDTPRGASRRRRSPRTLAVLRDELRRAAPRRTSCCGRRGIAADSERAWSELGARPRAARRAGEPRPRRAGRAVPGGQALRRAIAGRRPARVRARHPRQRRRRGPPRRPDARRRGAHPHARRVRSASSSTPS